jgi:hypothetical protein
MILTKGLLVRHSRLGMSVIPGITQLTPPQVGISARIRGGMGFGLHGMGDANPVTGLDPATMSLTDITTAIQQGLMVVNSQEVFNINLQRLQAGLAPIPTQFAAPTFNVGLAGVSTPMLLLGAGLLIFLLMRR